MIVELCIFIRFMTWGGRCTYYKAKKLWDRHLVPQEKKCPTIIGVFYITGPTNSAEESAHTHIHTHTCTQSCTHWSTGGIHLHVAHKADFYSMFSLHHNSDRIEPSIVLCSLYPQGSICKATHTPTHTHKYKHTHIYAQMWKHIQLWTYFGIKRIEDVYKKNCFLYQQWETLYAICVWQSTIQPRTVCSANYIFSVGLCPCIQTI